MLKITLPRQELYDEANREFITLPKVELQLEHSLVSLSKWESIHEKPFMGGLIKEEKTDEEIRSYIACMILNEDISADIVNRFTNKDFDAVNKYISAPMTATWITESKKKSQRSVITSEIIYYWMISGNIPFECQNWHLNRLLTLIKVISEKNSPQKKMSRQEIAARNRELNAQRKAQLGTKG